MAQDYLKILKSPEIVLWAKEVLRRSDRIVWYLKQVKNQPLIHPSLELKHAYSMNIPKINQFYNFKLSYTEILFEFHQMEQEYLEKLQKKNNWVEVMDSDEILLSLESDYSWVRLPSFYCPQESAAMGHCGNSFGKEGERLISLRQRVLRGDKAFWEPHLTFVLDSKGFLGEMKGRKNAKPSKEYHSQILELLSHPEIRGIIGGGFLSENNFSLQDLSDVDLNSFMEINGFKLLPLEREVIHNRKNPEYFKQSSPQTQMQAEIVSSWVTDENLLVTLVEQGNEYLAEAAILNLKTPQAVLQVCEKASEKLLSKVSFLKMNFTRSEKEELKRIAFVKQSKTLKTFLVRSPQDFEESISFLKQEIQESNPDKEVLSVLVYKLRIDKNVVFLEMLSNLLQDETEDKYSQLLCFMPQAQVVEFLLTAPSKQQKHIIKSLLHLGQIVKLLDRPLSVELKKYIIEEIINHQHLLEMLKYDVSGISNDPIEIYSQLEVEINVLLNHPEVSQYASKEKVLELKDVVQKLKTNPERLLI